MPATATCPREKHSDNLEREPSRELEGAGICAGEVERAEGAAVDIGLDLVVGGVVAEGDGIGHVLAIDSEDEFGTFGDVEGATQRAGETVHTRTTQTIGSDTG